MRAGSGKGDKWGPYTRLTGDGNRKGSSLYNRRVRPPTGGTPNFLGGKEVSIFLLVPVGTLGGILSQVCRNINSLVPSFRYGI